MRNYIANIRLAAVLVAPLFLACGSDGTGGGGTTYATVPTCSGTGQVLSTDSTGQLVCKSLPVGTAPIPACDAATKALTADGTSTECVDLNTVDAQTLTLLTTLTDIENKIIDYGTQVNKLGSGPSAQSAYVGLTKTAVTGRVTSGALVGIPAATAMCVGDFGSGSHMCTVYELYYSAALSKNLDPTTDVAPGGWVYMQSGRTGATSPVEPTAGLADNCGGYSYTYNGNDANQWNGTRFEWSTALANVRVPKFYANTLCNASYPIACCR